VDVDGVDERLIAPRPQSSESRSPSRASMTSLPL
jgi:hypothetical protein